MSAIEAVASEMLFHRRLGLPRNRIKMSDEVLDRLRSANVLFGGRSDHIGFGHQTLLDALAVADAERKNLSLVDFIRSLPAVPFVRPAIRAFFTHLKLGDARTFRSQVRAVFGADVAFHIKRLIAESLAAVAPQEDDWSLIRHLFRGHEVHFRFLYVAASGRSWHSYWMRHFVPLLLADGNVGWLGTHVRRVSIWAGEDPSGVIAFWTKAATSDWGKGLNLRATLGLELQKFPRVENCAPFPLLEALLRLPPVQHDFLGDVIAKCVSATNIGDSLLWGYVGGDVTPEHLTSYRLDQALRCGHEWIRDDDFLDRRMGESEELLSLAVASVEKWSAVIAEHHVKAPHWNNVFLEDTSHGEMHSRHDIRHKPQTTVLLRAMESAVLKHASEHSSWWQVTRRRLCLNPCGAFRYMGILALTKFPTDNAAEAKIVLLDNRTFDTTDELELGNLVCATAYFLDEVLDHVEQRILSRHEDRFEDCPEWVLAERYELLQRIPASLRSMGVVEKIRHLSTVLPPPTGQPSIRSTSGMVAPPFSSEELLALSDDGLITLLRNSRDLGRDHWSRMKLVGGVEQIGFQLQTASSKHPRRYLALLASRWADIDDRFRGPILDGAAAFLRYRHGNLQPPTDPWSAVEEIDGAQLASLILDELERHPGFWARTRAGAAGIEACAYVSWTNDLADRLLFFAAGYVHDSDPHCGERLQDDLLTTGINSSRGEVADAVMVLANNRAELGVDFPALLAPTLRQFARDCHPAVRTVILRRLSFLQYKSPLGWEVFDAAVDCDDERVWIAAEQCLYYSYEAHFARIKTHLDHIRCSPVAGVRETWARISALSSLSGFIAQDQLLAELATMDDKDAWTGAVSVWMANAHLLQHRPACFAALSRASESKAAREGVLREVHSLFRDGPSVTPVPASLLRALLEGHPQNEHQQFNLYGIDTWLAELAQVDPDHALDASEFLAEAAKSGTASLYDPDPIARLLTTLFREAEEREESDRGQMLARVINVQDKFLAGPLDSLDQWLRDAERPES